MRNVLLAGIAGLALAGAAQGANVGVDPSTGPWLGYMNVTDLGGNFQFGSPWGIGDLNSSFNDPSNTLTLSPNTIGDPNPYWYIGGGGPGAAGNKIMEANLYQETTGVYVGTSLTFSGNVLSKSFTSAHRVYAFIKDFAPDYSSSVTSFVEITGAGAFSVSLNTLNDGARHVQWGFQTVGVNVWTTDTGPFGNVVIQTIPAPTSLALLGLSGIVAGRRRRA